MPLVPLPGSAFVNLPLTKMFISHIVVYREGAPTLCRFCPPTPWTPLITRCGLNNAVGDAPLHVPLQIHESHQSKADNGSDSGIHLCPPNPYHIWLDCFTIVLQYWDNIHHSTLHSKYINTSINNSTHFKHLLAIRRRLFPCS